ncbi:MmcB family DNA repair protein [Acinetobacter sp. TGL-Y2]|uniref:MmcB family DNA repair protein n=1 Tax=Acinetobacter sp. TGL-Y2 TaxID=1407071 RepID=UPI001D179DF1|nr:MmcB family DNA repair protein [Acinetobacter sp. TGL-Y2]
MNEKIKIKKGLIVNNEIKWTHPELVEIGYNYVLKQLKFPIAAKELKCIGSREQPDVIAFRSNCSLMIECKTSMADFRADFKKPERQGLLSSIGNYRLYLAPKGLIKLSLIPERWGLLEVNDKGKVEVVKFMRGNIYIGNHAPEVHQEDDDYFHLSDLEKERAFLYSMMIR